jgi:nitroreductase
MDVMQAILTRRSIRQYQDQIIPEEMVKDLLRAAMSAPSAGDQRPWHFVVIDDRETLKAITQVHPHAQMLLTAPLAILICADQCLEKHQGYWVQDCSAATENLLLAAHADGLGAVWLGIHPRLDRENGIRELLKLPEQVLPLSLVAIGYPAENKPSEDRFMRERVHHNRW